MWMGQISELGVGEEGSYNKINWNLAGEQRFLLLQFPDPGSPQLEEVSDTFFFLMERGQGRLVLSYFLSGGAGYKT